MFGFNIKPAFLLKTLKNFGLDVSVMLPKVEDFIIREADKMEQETGKEVCIVVTRNREDNTILVSTYLREENGSLSERNTTPLKKIIERLLNEFKNEDDNTEPGTDVQGPGTLHLGADDSEAGGSNTGS